MATKLTKAQAEARKKAEAENRKKKNEGKTKLSTAGANINRATEEAAAIANKLQLTEPLVEIQGPDLTQMNNLTNQLSALTNPMSAGYTGNISTEGQDLLARLKGGLSGLNATENTALRDSMNEERNRNLQTQVAQLRRAQGGNVMGGAKSAQMQNIAESFGRQSDENERKLLVDNIGIKQKAAELYGNTLGQQEGAAANRLNAAQSVLANTLANRATIDNDVQKFNAGQKNTSAGVRNTATLGLAGTILGNQYNSEALKALAKNGGGGGGATPQYNNQIETLNTMLAQLQGGNKTL